MLSVARRRLIPSLPRRSSVLLPRRFASTGNRPPAPLPEGVAPGPYLNDSYATHTFFTLDFFRRFLKFSAVGVVALAVTSWTAFEGAHMWAEHVGLAPETDEEARKWEWDLESDKWSGWPKGGTDPALGFLGRHAVRGAWMVLRWGTGSHTSVVASKAFSGRGGSGATLAPIEAQLEYAQEFLRIAIEQAERASADGKLHPGTLNELLARRADVVERMGTRNALLEARHEYERVWASLPGQGIEAARVALKLGDLSRRLGDEEDTLEWWARTAHLALGKDKTSIPSVPLTVPESIPSSPLAQRTLISTLVSMSAFYATSGQLQQAQQVEESALRLLRAIPSPSSFADATPPQALHSLYVLHRSSILSIHLAEVLYALKYKPIAPVEWLRRAAESSERVALTLTGLPAIHPDAPGSRIPHPPSSETPLISQYTKSASMNGPAKNLLRDARRTAAEAWNLLGVLEERSGSADATAKALESYERALGWAGVATDKAGGIGTPGEGTLESEWRVFWANYVRARDAARKQEQK